MNEERHTAAQWETLMNTSPTRPRRRSQLRFRTKSSPHYLNCWLILGDIMTRDRPAICECELRLQCALRDGMNVMQHLQIKTTR